MAVDIGIDLGTANIIITVAGKGIVLNEPSVVAYDRKKKAVVAVGSEAYKMIGRTPEYIVAVRPLKDGVISDNDMTQAMIKEFISIVSGGLMTRPRVVLCVPSLSRRLSARALIFQNQTALWSWILAAERLMWLSYRSTVSCSHAL